VTSGGSYFGAFWGCCLGCIIWDIESSAQNVVRCSVTFDNNEFGRTIYISFREVFLPYDTIFDRHMGRSVRILKLGWYWLSLILSRVLILGYFL